MRVLGARGRVNLSAAVLAPAYAFTPYCGAPPTPATLLTRWNLDPILLASLVVALAAYLILSRRDGQPAWRRLSFCAGWLIGALALVSPLCPLSVALSAGRIGQHMLLVSIVAPLIVLGRPARVCGWRFNGLSGPHAALTAAVVFAGMLWVWHAPGPYVATFLSTPVYWLMHLSVFGGACWLWASLFDAAGDGVGSFLAAALITTLQMGFLGALITFASHPLYPVHALTTQAWGLTPMQDQQLGGVIMWIPAGAVFLAAVVYALASAMRRGEAMAVARAAR
jgi:putative membrane protein